MVNSSTPGWSIEAFSSDILDRAAALFVEVFNAPPWKDEWTVSTAHARLHAVIETPGFVGVAAHRGDDLLGFAIGHTEQAPTGLHFSLNEMCVDPDLQRGGIGTALLEALTARLPDVEQIYLLTMRDSAAQRFYERCGFRPARRQHVMVKSV